MKTQNILNPKQYKLEKIGIGVTTIENTLQRLLIKSAMYLCKITHTYQSRTMQPEVNLCTFNQLIFYKSQKFKLEKGKFLQ